MWEWGEAGRRFPGGRLVTGSVTAHLPFGVFVGLGDPGATGLVEVPEFLDAGRMTADQCPQVGTAATAVATAPGVRTEPAAPHPSGLYSSSAGGGISVRLLRAMARYCSRKASTQPGSHCRRRA